MKYVVIISQIAAVLFLLLDLFEVVNSPELRVLAYFIIIISLGVALLISARKNRA